MMKIHPRLLTGTACCLLLAALSPLAGAADAVAPASVGITSIRDEAVATLAGTYYRGDTLLLTGCVAYAGTTTNAARQGLDTVAIEVRVGTLASNAAYSGTMAGAASNGTWWATITVPTNEASQYLQLRITDSQTNSYTYPWKLLSTRERLE